MLGAQVGGWLSVAALLGGQVGGCLSVATKVGAHPGNPPSVLLPRQTLVRSDKGERDSVALAAA